MLYRAGDVLYYARPNGWAWATCSFLPAIQLVLCDNLIFGCERVGGDTGESRMRNPLSRWEKGTSDQRCEQATHLHAMILPRRLTLHHHNRRRYYSPLPRKLPPQGPTTSTKENAAVLGGEGKGEGVRCPVEYRNHSSSKSVAGCSAPDLKRTAKHWMQPLLVSGPR